MYTRDVTPSSDTPDFARYLPKLKLIPKNFNAPIGVYYIHILTCINTIESQIN